VRDNGKTFWGCPWPPILAAFYFFSPVHLEKRKENIRNESFKRGWHISSALYFEKALDYTEMGGLVRPESHSAI
jgi:hypothetical protein